MKMFVFWDASLCNITEIEAVSEMLTTSINRTLII
jgi:hypothetical protein